MEFRLTYEGELFGASKTNTRAPHKHQLRRVFHRQLKRLWEIHPIFHNYQPSYIQKQSEATRSPLQNEYENLLRAHNRRDYHFIPIVTERLSLLCSLDILFLRPDMPGSVLSSGDIDNRLKTIFDALRIPQNDGELGGHDAPDVDEDPFFCLLVDDGLIAHVSVTTDTLLQPTGDTWNANDARLVLKVGLRPYRVSMDNMSYAG